MDASIAEGEDKPGARVSGREIFGWCCYDFANSAYTTIVITVVYSIYFTQVVAGGSGVANTLWATTLGIAEGAVIVAAPLLGAVADSIARKKRFLMLAGLLLVVSTAGLSLTGAGGVALAIPLLVVSSIAFALGEIFCASFLPQLSTPQTAGKISGYGWSFGYVGGLVSLALCIGIVGSDPVSDPNGVRVAMLVTAGFMALAMVPTLLFLRERATPRGHGMGEALRQGWAQLAGTFRHLSGQKDLALFLVAFALFMSGLSAIIKFAAIFANKELGFTMKELIALFLILQVGSCAGAFALGFLQDRIGSLKTLSITLGLWILVSILAGFCQTKTMFFVVGNLAGLAIGSTQSASRAVVSLLAPAGRPGESFSYWGTFARIAGISGPFVMGLLSDSAGMRTAVIANGVFFALGLAVLWPLRTRLRPEGR